MKKAGILNRHPAGALAELGHGDGVLVCDAGMPIPEGPRGTSPAGVCDDTDGRRVHGCDPVPAVAVGPLIAGAGGSGGGTDSVAGAAAATLEQDAAAVRQRDVFGLAALAVQVAVRRALRQRAFRRPGRGRRGGRGHDWPSPSSAGS
ncbi:RbsD/FucU domain-containing protein [Streptomyces sp. NBC_00287]|uniref:RbsD/FucU domain-containing protein n=1 Tax=Streptomyces sp. NBC_00287 TaxID=2975702 RepID=UPI003FA7A98D